MFVKLCLSMLLPLSIGFLLLDICLSMERKIPEVFLLKCSLAVGLGFGITSCSYFLCLLTVGPTITGLILSEAGMFVLLMILFIYTGKAPTSNEYDIGNEKTLHDLKLSRILSIGFGFVLLSAFANFVALELHTPHGAWDSWAIWNLRARFIFRGGEYWTDAFSNLLSTYQHPDYPLLVPLTVARSWSYIGKETQVVPITVAFFFTFAIAGIIYSALTILRSKSQGILAGLFLMSTTIFIFLGAYQYGDVPLGFFFLSSIVFIFFQERFPKNYNLSLLAGAMAGLSGWTKNEGLLFLLCLFLVCSSLTVFSSDRKEHMKQLAYLALGSVPFLLMLIYFKINLAPPNEIVSKETIMREVIGKLGDYSRYVKILKAFIIYALLNFPHFLLLIVYPLIFRIKIDDTSKKSIIISSVVLVLMFTGFFLVYQITPHDLDWHLEKSLPRLLAQLWPSILFTYFMIVRTPEEALMK